MNVDVKWNSEALGMFGSSPASKRAVLDKTVGATDLATTELIRHDCGEPFQSAMQSSVDGWILPI